MGKLCYYRIGLVFMSLSCLGTLAKVPPAVRDTQGWCTIGCGSIAAGERNDGSQMQVCLECLHAA